MGDCATFCTKRGHFFDSHGKAWPELSRIFLDRFDELAIVSTRPDMWHLKSWPAKRHY